jgi:patatin-like phospholipase/acyl hydrolase
MMKKILSIDGGGIRGLIPSNPKRKHPDERPLNPQPMD